MVCDLHHIKTNFLADRVKLPYKTTMNRDDRLQLTKLFRKEVEHRELDYRSVSLSIETGQGTEITISSLKPRDAARYLRNFLTTHHDLFQRMHLDNGIPSPIVLKIDGWYRHETLEKEYRLEPALMIRFMQEDQPSQVIINYDTYWSPSDDRQAHMEGPAIKDFIRILEKADDDWNKVNFTHRTPPHGTHLKLVKG